MFFGLVAATAGFKWT